MESIHLTPKQADAILTCYETPSGVSVVPARTAAALIEMGLVEKTSLGAGRGRSNIRLTAAGKVRAATEAAARNAA